MTFLEDAGKVSLMTRIAMVVIPGLPHHLTQRGNRRQRFFFCDDDYREYIALMANSCWRYEVDVLVNDWRGFLGVDIAGEEMERFRLHERTGRPMGDGAFLEGIEKTTSRVMRPQKPGPKKRDTNN